MKKNEWKVIFTNTDFYFELVTMNKDNSNKVMSAGLVFHKDKAIQGITIRSDDMWTKPRKKQGSPKTVLYSLAHQLATALYTDGKKGLADTEVGKWLGVDSEAVRTGRGRMNKHLKKIDSKTPLSIYFDGNDGNQFSIMLLDYKIPQLIDLPIEYTGRYYLWEKGEDDISINHGTIFIT